MGETATNDPDPASGSGKRWVITLVVVPLTAAVIAGVAAVIAAVLPRTSGSGSPAVAGPPASIASGSGQPDRSVSPARPDTPNGASTNPTPRPIPQPPT